MESPLLKIPEVAAILRCHPWTVRMLIRRCQLPFLKVGRLVFLRKESVEQWIRSRETRKKIAIT